MVPDSKEMLLPTNTGHHKGTPCLQEACQSIPKGELVSCGAGKNMALRGRELYSGAVIRSKRGTGLQVLAGPSLGAPAP